MLQTLVENALIGPVTLTFEPENRTISRISQGHSFPIQLRTLWDHSFLSYAPDKQTDDLIILPASIDSVGESNNEL